MKASTASLGALVVEAARDLEHGPGCSCTRCAGFEPGHELSVRHGAYASVLRLTPRVDEIIAALLKRMPPELADQPAFGPAVEGVAIAGARLEKALAALEDEAKPSELRRLEQDMRGWVRQWQAGLAGLGITPSAASRMGLNLALTGAARQRLSLQQLAALELKEKGGG